MRFLMPPMNGTSLMNPRIKKIWVSALRSGELEQVRGKLRKAGNKYCCLGVLCELAVREGVIPPAQWDYNAWSYCGSREYLPYEVRYWAGINAMNPQVFIPDPDDPEKTLESTLAELNDTGSSFDEIADIIEDQL